MDGKETAHPRAGRPGNSHNLGAIVRSAAFFGIQDILLVDDPKTDPLSTSAYRVAEGGMELVALSRCADLGGLFGPRRSEFPLIGADQRGALSVFDEKALPRTGRAFALLLGNEERGLSDAARRACSSTVRIPGSGGLESLNVAQAAAVFMALMFGRRS
jgi:TrmH RNA methyltransferase